MPDDVLGLIRSCQQRGQCELGGGAALAGVYLAHRLSQDIDIFFRQRDDLRQLVQALPSVARESGWRIDLVRDAGEFVRAHCAKGNLTLEMDVVVEATPDLRPPPPPVEGVVVRSLEDLRASKLTCLLSRSEPRDLVDALFLERAGFPPEKDLPLALQKDRGMDPGILAWLLNQFPTHPLPKMLEPLTESELLSFRDTLRDRFKALAVPASE